MKIYTVNQEGQIEKQKIEDAFSFLKTGKHIISLVGAGGKTSIMYALSEYCAKQGKHTLVSTTTHIWKPLDGSYAACKEDMIRLWKEHQYAVVGVAADEHKLKMLPEDVLREYMEMADIVFLESDGARRFPCKAPRTQEPVIIEESDIVLAILGLDAIGRPLRESCLGQQELLHLLKEESDLHLMTTSDFICIFSSVQGSRKNVEHRQYYAVANKCDIDHGKEYGQEIITALKTMGYENAVMTEMV